MTLPAITTPAGTPVFLASGHDVEEDAPFAQWRPATGHSRARRVFTVAERVARVEWLLGPGQLEAVEEWFETTLQAGTRTFSARIRNEEEGALLVWWEARWISIEYEMMPLGRARVSGSLMLFGDPSEEPPEFGLLAAEFLVELKDVRSTVYGPTALSVEFRVPLITSYPSALAAEFRIEITQDEGGGVTDRLTEDDNTRETEDGQTRVTED